MKVLIVNTSEKTGGAALAAKRLMEALNNNGVKAKMLVRDKETEQITVVPLPSKLMQQWHFLWDRFKIYCHLWFSKNHLFDIDTASSGADITKLPEFKEAEIIHLHWVNQGMLSLKGIKKILDSGKPVVWTMHDVWPATAICHLTLDCRKFENRCHHCRLLPNGVATTTCRQRCGSASASCWRTTESRLWLAANGLLARQRRVDCYQDNQLRIFQTLLICECLSLAISKRVGWLIICLQGRG